MSMVFNHSKYRRDDLVKRMSGKVHKGLDQFTIVEVGHKNDKFFANKTQQIVNRNASIQALSVT